MATGMEKKLRERHPNMAVRWVVVVLCTLSQGLRMLRRKVAVLIRGVDRVEGKWCGHPGGHSPMEGNVIMLIKKY
jgi:hypothetical protein